MLSLTFGEQVKIVLSRKNMTIKELAEEIEKKTGKKMSRQNLTQRLGRDNFQEQDMRMIAEILDCPFQLNILSDEDRHGEVSEDIYAVKPSDERKDKKKKGKTIFLEPQTDLFQRMDELSSSERDITIGELVDIHEQLEQLEQEKMVDVSGETGVLEYEVPGEETQEEDNSEAMEKEAEALAVTDDSESEEIESEETGEPEAGAEEADAKEADTEVEAEEEEGVPSKEQSEEQTAGQEKDSEDMKEETAAESDKEKEEIISEEEKQEAEAQVVEEKAAEPAEEPEPQIIQAEPKPAKKKKPLISVLKGYIRKESKAAARDTREPEQVEEPVKEEAVKEEPVREETDAATEASKEPEVQDEAREVAEEKTQETREEAETEMTESETEHQAEPRRKRGPQMMPGGIGEVNPYTGKEYETNSVRMHPNRIGYIQVYDRGEHQWADMTEWAFLGYQERKKALLGDQYEPPIYLD